MLCVFISITCILDRKVFQANFEIYFTRGFLLFIRKNGFYPSFSELKLYLRNRGEKPANFKFIILSQFQKKKNTEYN